MKIDLKNISTESRNKNTSNIDTLSTLEIVKLLNSEDQTVPLIVGKIVNDISKAIDLIVSGFKDNGRLFYVGAGTSGRLGILDASEMPPTYNTKKDMFIGIIAGGKDAIQNPIEGVEDDINQSIIDLKKFNFSSKDILVGISASGRTPYVVSALKYANSLKSKTISIATSKNSEISKLANVKLEAVTGAEPITGSTRMKSGTAQKLILNYLSTASMIKMGKVYGNLMIDIVALNEKLKERAKNIVSEITDVSLDIAGKYLEKCNYLPKVAIVMILKNVSSKEAKIILNNNGNILIKIK